MRRQETDTLNWVVDRMCDCETKFPWEKKVKRTLFSVVLTSSNIVKTNCLRVTKIPCSCVTWVRAWGASSAWHLYTELSYEGSLLSCSHTIFLAKTNMLLLDGLYYRHKCTCWTSAKMMFVVMSHTCRAQYQVFGFLWGCFQYLADCWQAWRISVLQCYTSFSPWSSRWNKTPRDQLGTTLTLDLGLGDQYSTQKMEGTGTRYYPGGEGWRPRKGK